MPGPPPHVGPCKRCGGSDDVTGLGRYRGLCAECRPIVASEQAQARGARIGAGAERDGMEGDTRQKAPALKLASVCKGLVVKAERLEHAIDRKRLAHRDAQAAVAEFKAQVSLIGRVAQSLVNTVGQSSDAP